MMELPFVIFGFVSVAAAACGNGVMCPPADPCCSRWGHCGRTDAYCGADCICGCRGLTTVDYSCNKTGGDSSGESSPRCLPSSCSPTVTIVSDMFSSYAPGAIITDDSYYNFGTFPDGGTSKTSNPSSIWEADTGGFVFDNGFGFSKKPNSWPDRWFFRLNTRSFGAKDCVITWKYKSAPFGEDGFSVEGSDAVDLWLRYQTQYNLYFIQFDRTDHRVVAKRKIPAEGWRGPSGDVSNKGVYYALTSDSTSPSGGGKRWDIGWPQGMANLAHDKSTVYNFAASVITLPSGKVQLRLWRDGTFVASWTDDGRTTGMSASGGTQGQHIDAGHYNSVRGWQAEWGKQITRAGATGFRADNIKCWFDDFIVKELDPSLLGNGTIPIVVSSSGTIEVKSPSEPRTSSSEKPQPVSSGNKPSDVEPTKSDSLSGRDLSASAGGCALASALLVCASVFIAL